MIACLSPTSVARGQRGSDAVAKELIEWKGIVTIFEGGHRDFERERQGDLPNELGER